MRFFLARDRLGIEPLYYLEWRDQPLLFASKITALLRFLTRLICPSTLMLGTLSSLGILLAIGDTIKVLDRLVRAVGYVVGSGRLASCLSGANIFA